MTGPIPSRPVVPEVHPGRQMNTNGENLIFLISQPRAGSTLLQRMLGSHPDIHTVSEPWLMLHPLYALRGGGFEAEYDAGLARDALANFVRSHPKGEDGYIEGVRRMYTYLYQGVMETAEKKLFLDKTPRYYSVIPELYRTFPKARYIILFRNPLAVLCSVLETWVREDWFRLFEWRHDLVRGPKLLVDGVENLGQAAIVVQYEKLVGEPMVELRRICDGLAVSFTQEMIDYGRSSLPCWQWHLGDHDVVYQHDRPVTEHLNKWLAAIRNPQVWRLMYEYLEVLGPETLRRMGYSHEELCDKLEMSRPSRIRSSLAFPFATLVAEGNSPCKRPTRMTVRGAVITAVRKIVSSLSGVSWLSGAR